MGWTEDEWGHDLGSDSGGVRGRFANEKLFQVPGVNYSYNQQMVTAANKLLGEWPEILESREGEQQMEEENTAAPVMLGGGGGFA